MKSKLLVSLLLVSGLATFGNAAMASDEVAGAILGAGAGAIIGHSIDHGDGAVVGGILGAIIGVAIANDDDDYDRRRVVVHQPPRVRYVTQPVFVEHHPHFGWRHDQRWERRDDRREDRWERRDDRRDDRQDRRDERRDRRGW